MDYCGTYEVTSVEEWLFINGVDAAQTLIDDLTWHADDVMMHVTSDSVTCLAMRETEVSI